jgi:hypothetical protein
MNSRFYCYLNSRFIITYSLLFCQIIFWNSKNKEGCHHGPRVNMIDMVLLSTKYSFYDGSSSSRNEVVNRARAVSSLRIDFRLLLVSM